MATNRAPSQDWNDDLFLQGVAIGLLTSAMGSGDGKALMGAVAALRQRGVNLAELYRIAQRQNPDAPTLEELERMPASAASASGEGR